MSWLWFPLFYFIVCFLTFNIFDQNKSIPLVYYIKHLSTGVTEEVLFRSLCFGLLIYKLKNTKNYIFKAALISSFAFGAVHILNLFADVTSVNLWVLTGIQLLYATFIGLGLAGHTYKNNSIFIPILIHFIINVFTDDGLAAKKIIENSYLPLYLVVCGIGIPYILYGIKILLDTREKSN
jgi:membrane protease YdiL (CAAX protease family)